MQQPSNTDLFNLSSLQPLPHWPVGSRLTAPARGAMEIGGLLNARNAVAADAHMRQQFHHTMRMDSQAAYAMNHAVQMGHAHQQHPMGQSAAMGFPQMNHTPHQQMMTASFMNSTHPNPAADMDDNNNKPRGDPAPKSFACSTCAKGFARRSDLARHERIHSGERPHKCDFPGCDKEFIQRSALTVHSRVHTGEKPHMCERCGKRFSDSSSLARHRRIHSGKRPYKCPYANCQKTFTRRTTLTRHQNQHTGTIEQAALETSAKLSVTQAPSQARSADGSYSDNLSSGTSAASPQRPLSISPTNEVQSATTMSKQAPDFQFLAQNHSIPHHMRNEYQTSSVRTTSSLSAPPQQAYSNTPSHRPTMTSHPSSFGPPQTLEPPTANNGNGNASPHLGGMTWGSPAHAGLTSPSGMEAYGYDPNYGGQQLYYPGSNIRRPQSTEPDDYGIRSRHMNHHLAHHMHMGAEWSAIPNLHEMKQERAFAM